LVERPDEIGTRVNVAVIINKKNKHAGIAQLVERNLAKVDVAGSSPVSRSRHKVFGARLVQ
jgi:hypothetical protein